MTVRRLIRELEKLDRRWGPRCTVYIDKNTVRHPLEDDGVFPALAGARFRLLNVVDGDGFAVENRDGTERLHRSVVLFGEG